MSENNSEENNRGNRPSSEEGVRERRFRAIRTYERACLDNPHDAAIWNRIGNDLSDVREHKLALYAHDKAMEIDPNDPKTWKLKGNALHFLRKYDEALETYDKGLEMDPKSPENWQIWRDKGVLFRSLRKYIEAVDSFDRAVQINPGLPELWQNLGSALCYLKKYDEAGRVFDKVLEICPTDAHCWKSRGNALRRLGLTKEADECFIRAETFRSEMKDIEGVERQTRNARIFASNFVDSITIGQDSLSQLRSVLKARGFLLEDELEPDYDPERIFLSNYCHANDALYLDNQLRKNKIGHIFSDDSPYRAREYQEQRIPLPLMRREVFITGEISKDKLILFIDKHRGGEARNIARYSGCAHNFDAFKKRKSGPKIDVVWLEFYIARLVKTLNAIGITTQYSCDGNVWVYNARKSNPFIQLTCVYDSIWLAILMEKFVIPEKRLTNKWQIGELPLLVNSLIMSPTNGWLSLYLEIQNVAEILYKNRINIRNWKPRYFADLSEEEFTCRIKKGYQGSLVFSEEFLRMISSINFGLNEEEEEEEE